MCNGHSSEHSPRGSRSGLGEDRGLGWWEWMTSRQASDEALDDAVRPTGPDQLPCCLGSALSGVIDSGGEAPRRREPDFVAETGRGLHIVESFSERWGWTPLPAGGKIV